ncbi:hypothetical protein BH10ACI2_BH10ACI2_10280 [soil metagenome]
MSKKEIKNMKLISNGLFVKSFYCSALRVGSGATPGLLISGLAVAIIILFLNTACHSQNTVTGAFQGDIKDSQTGDPKVGVVVQITSDQSGVIYTAITDTRGQFYKGLLAPGSYVIKTAVPGYKPQSIRLEIRVSLIGDVVPVPISLEPDPAGTAQPAVVQPPVNIRIEINTTDARRDGSTKGEEITKIPLGSNSFTRSFDELALLLPGVAPPPQTIGDVAGPGVGPGVGSAGQFAVNGLRSRANNFTVDGSDNNDEDIGVRRQGFVALIPQPVESVQEFQIITLLAPAQYGRNIGAQVNAVSRTGENTAHGAVYGFLNSHQLNARNFFDSTNGNSTFALKTTTGQTALLDGQPLTVRNQSGGKDKFTFGQLGGVVGGAIVKEKLFYFLSGEYQKINASQEKNFAVPTIEQRGPFRTGATGTNVSFFSGQTLPNPLFPNEPRSDAIFSLIPFANNPTGVYGENTLTQSLPAGGRGGIFSGRLDDDFKIAGRQQRLSGRYNFTDDKKNIPSVNDAIFSTVLSKIQTQNLSLFLNGGLKRSDAGSQLLNQVRFSIGRTRLNFDEVRNTDFLRQSDELPGTPFLLNAPARYNVSLPQFNGQARFTRLTPSVSNPVPESAENIIGPVGQIVISGFSPLGVDVYNFPQNRINKTYQLADELTWRVRSHAVVFGADTRRTELNSDLPRLARTLITFNGSPRLVLPTPGVPCANGGAFGFCFLPTTDPRAIIRPEDLAGLGAASNSILTLNVDRPDSRVNLRYYQLNFFGQDTWRVTDHFSMSFGVRYEYNTPVKEVDGLIENTFSDQRLSTLPVLKRLLDGRSTLYAADRNNFAPRIGVAYSPNLFGKNLVSVFRAGYGLFYDQILGAVANQSRNVFPTFLTLNLGGLSNFPGQALTIGNPAIYRISTPTDRAVFIRRPGTQNMYNGPELTSNGVPFADFIVALGGLYRNAVNVTLPSKTLEMPMAHHYSFSFEQQLNQNLSVSVGYVGTSGRHLLRFTTPNLGSSLTTVPTSLGSLSSSFPNVPLARGSVLIPNRPLDRTDAAGNFETLGAVNQFETTASSTYNSLQTQLRGRFLELFNFQLSYTFSKVTDDVSDVFDLAGASVLPQNSLDLGAERGPANFDIRHRYAYSAIYNFRQQEGSGFLRRLTNGLQIATKGSFHSGQPFTVNSVIDVNLDGNLTDRLNTLTGIEQTGDRSQPVRLTTTNTNSLLAPFGKAGQIGRNTFRAGNVFELDASVLKKFDFGSNHLTFRTDIFNFLNRANFGVPVRLLEAPGFGKATSTVTPGRRIQFALKYEF